MMWKRPVSLGKMVEARASNRAVKIAYLVPFDDVERTQLILDAVFFESYTRWSGIYTLIVPTENADFASDGYADWLSHFDADFIYSYIDLDPDFVDKIDRLCCPIAFLRHNEIEPEEKVLQWRAFLPQWSHYIKPVPSISTVQSPESYPQLHHEKRPPEPTIYIQFGSGPLERMLADNFGAGFTTHNSSNPVAGLFRTLSLVPDDLPSHMIAGTERCADPLEAFQGISERRITPISRLAMINSGGMPRVESASWAFAFRIFIGSTPRDRINFWNARLLGSSWSDTANALIMRPSFFYDDAAVKKLGIYLNKHNFLGGGNGPYQVQLHSLSETSEVLAEIRKKIQDHSFNAIHVSEMSGADAIPTKQDLLNRSHKGIGDTSVLKLTEDYVDVVAEEPAHFTYLPPQRRPIAEGDWIVELDIDRHNNLSRFVNVVDTWTLPRRWQITRAFTDRNAKPTRAGALALIPKGEGPQIRRAAVKDPRSYELRLPTDENFFRHLALNFHQYMPDDLRVTLPVNGYEDMATSDKGQNLRGVISLFDNLDDAHGILTKKYWRTVLGDAKDDKARPLNFDMNKLKSFMPGDRKTLEKLSKELRFKEPGTIREYLNAGLYDTLEYLVRQNVFYQVAHWRCRYCGHVNARSFDSMKIKNGCEICSTEYFAPIDIEWQYEVSGFVHRSLHKHSGLPVLWTLGYLQSSLYNGSFWYLPEVDLYEKGDDKSPQNEIDILCMMGGRFHAVEVKRTASMFLNQAGSADKFLRVMERLCPDVAVLSFERYCADSEERAGVKDRVDELSSTLKERLGPWIKLRIIVAEQTDEFDDFSPDLGWRGSRVSSFNNRE